MDWNINRCSRARDKSPLKLPLTIIVVGVVAPTATTAISLQSIKILWLVGYRHQMVYFLFVVAAIHSFDWGNLFFFILFNEKKIEEFATSSDEIHAVFFIHNITDYVVDLLKSKYYQIFVPQKLTNKDFYSFCFRFFCCL